MSPTAKPVKPLSSDYYDVVRQRSALPPGQSTVDERQQQEAAFKARMRFDYLFAPSITLSRADVLDGACLLNVNPETISGDWFGGMNTPAVTILTRTGRLETDLLDWSQPSTVGTQYDHLFYALPATVQDEVALNLPHYLKGTDGTWRSLARAIGQATGRPEFGDQLSHGWNLWCNLNSPAFTVRKFPEPPAYLPHFPPELPEHDLASVGIDSDTSLSNEARRHYARARLAFETGGWQRAALTRWNEAHRRDTDRLVANLVEQRFQTGIGRARAVSNDTQHEVLSELAYDENWLHNAGARLLTDDAMPPEERAPIELPLPPGLIRALAGCEYRPLHRTVAKQRDTWLASGSYEDLKTLSFSVVEALAAQTPIPEMSLGRSQSRILRGVVGATAGAVTIAALVDGASLFGAVWKAASDGLTLDQLAVSSAEMATAAVQRRRYVHQLVQAARREDGQSS